MIVSARPTLEGLESNGTESCGLRLPAIPQLWEAALRQLRLFILSGELPANTHLVETELAARMGVSRGPIRQAIVRLEQEGFVQISPRQGAFVREITPAMIQEKYALRQLLEVYAVRLAAQRCAEEDLAALRGQCQEMDRSVAARNLEAFYTTQHNFHRGVVCLAGMETLTRMWDLVGTSIGALMMLNLYYGQGNSLVDQDFWESNTAAVNIAAAHLDLLAPIAMRDEERAARMMHEHLEVGERSVLAALETARERHAH